MKKVLSLVLVIAMVLSSMSFAFAANFEDVADTDYAKAINTLVGLGVVTGYEDGTYRPEKVVTRAEMAKLIVEILGYGDLVAGAKSNFTDTQGHWADAWIALAAGKGLVVGTGDGKFTPDRTVSYDEAITMVVRALGYTDDANELKGMTWPTNFKVKAAELKLTKDVALNATGADRGGVAQLLYNALNATIVTVNADKDVVKSTTTRTVVIGGVSTVVTEFVPLLSRLATIDNTTYQPVQFTHVDPESVAYAGDVVDLAPYMYQNITVYVNDDDEVVFVKSTDNLVLEGVIDEVADVAGTVVRVENAAGDEYTFNVTATTDLLLNGEEPAYVSAAATAATVASTGKGAPIKVTVVLDADDEAKMKNGYEALGIVAEKATDEVRASRDYVTGRTKIGTIALPTDSDGDVELDKITVVGDADSLEDIKEDSVVTAYAGHDSNGNLNKIKLAVSNNTVEGLITKTNHDVTTATVDGATYKQTATNLVGNVSKIAAGEEGTLFLNADGYYFEFDLTSDSEAKDYAVVVGASPGVHNAGLNSFTTDAKVRLATQNDEKVNFVIAEDADINGTTNNAANTATIDTHVSAGTVVEYSLDSDGNIDYIKNVVYVAGNTAKPIATDVKSFILADNAVIFDHDSTFANPDLYQVLSEVQLDDNIIADVVYNSDGEIELLVVQDGAKPSVATYAIINNVEVTTNASNKTVILFTAYVDGVKVTYNSDADFYKNDIGLGKTYASVAALRTAVRGGFLFNTLGMDGNEVTSIAPVTTTSAFGSTTMDYVEGNVTDVKVANGVISLAGGTVIALADDVVIYLQTDTAVVEVTDIDDIDADPSATTLLTDGDSIKAVDDDNDGEFDYVVIKER